jgi:hypothetical protein
MTNHSDIGIQLLKIAFYECGVIIDGYLGLLIEDDVDFDSSRGNLFEDIVEATVFVIELARSLEQKVRGDHPSGDEDVLLGCQQFHTHVTEVVLPVHVEFGLAVLSDRCETVETLFLRIGAVTQTLEDGVDEQHEIVEGVGFQSYLSGCCL